MCIYGLNMCVCALYESFIMVISYLLLSRIMLHGPITHYDNLGIFLFIPSFWPLRSLISLSLLVHMLEGNIWRYNKQIIIKLGLNDHLFLHITPASDPYCLSLGWSSVLCIQIAYGRNEECHFYDQMTFWLDLHLEWGEGATSYVTLKNQTFPERSISKVTFQWRCAQLSRCHMSLVTCVIKLCYMA